MALENRPWNLESFVDALVMELDKAREKLAFKAINRPLTYSVKDMSMDLQIFPTYDGSHVQFVSAKPGEQGASKISLQLASITDQQVRVTSKLPDKKDDISLDKMGVDDDTKKSLRSIGVTSIRDLEEIDNKNIDLQKVIPKSVDFTNLSNLIAKSKHSQFPPKVNKVSLSMSRATNDPVIVLEGQNLYRQQAFQPVAVLDNKLVTVLKATESEIHIALEKDSGLKGRSELILAVDPYRVFKINIKDPQA
jgi:hypothetical protein